MECVSLLFWSVGCDSKNKVSIDNSIVNNIVSNVVNSNVVTAGNSTFANQTRTFTVGSTGVLDCPEGFSLTQTINANMNVVQKFDMSQVTQLTNSLNNHLDNIPDQSLKQQNELLSQAQSGTNITDFRNQVKNVINSQAFQTNLFTSLNSFALSQDEKIEINGTIKGTSCRFGQDIIVDIVVSNVVSMIQNTLMKDEVVSDVINKVQQHLDSTSKGLGSLLLYAVPIAIIILIAILAYFLFRSGFSMSPGQGQVQNYTQGAFKKFS
jgi:predicted PurR-regulated permease PerM